MRRSQGELEEDVVVGRLAREGLDEGLVVSRVGELFVEMPWRIGLAKSLSECGVVDNDKEEPRGHGDLPTDLCWDGRLNLFAPFRYWRKHGSAYHARTSE